MFLLFRHKILNIYDYIQINYLWIRELANKYSESLLLKCTSYAVPKDQEETVLMLRFIKGKKKW